MMCVALVLLLSQTGCRQRAATPSYDIIIRGGQLYDGTGAAPQRADIGIRGDTIVKVGLIDAGVAAEIVDAGGRAVAPGFINMLSWSTDTLIADGNSQSEIRQGVTTQIMGEGESMGPLTPEMKIRMEAEQGDIRFPIEWTTLAEYLQYLERRGISQNVASFIGAATVREYVVGLEDREPTPEQMESMRKLVRQEMEAGALGIGSSLIYPPGAYARTEELVELCKVAAQYGGKYISHIRSEGNNLIEAVTELIRISREAGLPAEVYHLKAAGEANWPKMDQVIRIIEDARASGLKITADMYTYTAGSTGLSACIPPWVQSGGPEQMRLRFANKTLRRRIAEEIVTPTQDWENFYTLVGNPERILLVEFKKDELKPLQGKTLAQVAAERKKPAPEVIMDLMTEDETRVGAVYFLMSEANVRKQLQLSWVSFGSDAGSMAAEGVFLRSFTHPRAYGNFARLLGKYVRAEKIIPLEEAIRRLTQLPAVNLGLDRRGVIREGAFADLVVFDPARIIDHATYELPHQYATGVDHVLVNGKVVLRRGQHTGVRPGRALRGPGKPVVRGPWSEALNWCLATGDWRLATGN